MLTNWYPTFISIRIPFYPLIYGHLSTIFIFPPPVWPSPVPGQQRRRLLPVATVAQAFVFCCAGAGGAKDPRRLWCRWCPQNQWRLCENRGLRYVSNVLSGSDGLARISSTLLAARMPICSLWFHFRPCWAPATTVAVAVSSLSGPPSAAARILQWARNLTALLTIILAAREPSLGLGNHFWRRCNPLKTHENDVSKNRGRN